MIRAAVLVATAAIFWSPVAVTQPATQGAQSLKSEWTAALKAAYIETKRTVDDAGTASFAACFEGAPPKCQLTALAKRDEFRKLTTFTPTSSAMLRFGGSKYIHSYVSVLDCGVPAVLLDANYFARGGWIFLSRASVMSDGELLLDHAFAHFDVKRDNESYGVNESGVWIASDADLSALRKIASGSAPVIRLSGDKGYVTVSKEDARKFKTDAKEVMAIYDKLLAAVAGKSPKACR